jgi:hypothetical protein
MHKAFTALFLEPCRIDILTRSGSGFGKNFGISWGSGSELKNGLKILDFCSKTTGIWSLWGEHHIGVLSGL